MQLSDCSGTIELVAFNQLASENLISTMELHKVYKLSYVEVKEMNLGCQKWPSRTGSAFELLVTKETEIIQINEPSSLYIFQEASRIDEPQTAHFYSKQDSESRLHSKYSNYVALSVLESLKPDSIISVLGLISQVDTVRTLPNKDDLSLRNFRIIDTTSQSVSVAVWGKEAEEFSFEIDDIVDISKCKLTNFGGRSLSVLWSTTLRKVDLQHDLTTEVSKLVDFSLNLKNKRKLSDDSVQNITNKILKSD